MVEILRVIGARRIGDAKIGAQERCAEFRDELFHGVGLIAEAFAELAIAAALMARVMGQLMQERGIVSLSRCARR